MQLQCLIHWIELCQLPKSNTCKFSGWTASVEFNWEYRCSTNLAHLKIAFGSFSLITVCSFVQKRGCYASQNIGHYGCFSFCMNNRSASRAMKVI